MKTPKNIRSTIAVAVFFMLSVSIFQSCKKNQANVLLKVGSLNDSSFRSLPALAVPTTISKGLIAYWPCANTPYDLSGNGHNGTLHEIINGADRFGHPNGAYHFDGNKSYVEVIEPRNDVSLRLNNTDFTVNAWIRMKEYGQSFGSLILSKHKPGVNNGWTWGIAGDLAAANHVQIFGPGSTLNNGQGSVTVTLNTWHMVTTTYNLAQQTLKFYIDGVLNNTVANIASPNASINSALYIGRDDPYNGSFNGYVFFGLINDIRIYNREINPTEMTTLLNATTAPTSGLLAFWPLTKTAGDLSGKQNNGVKTSGVGAITDRFGNPNGAFHFDGTGYISVRDSAALRLKNTDFTMNAWIHLPANSASASSMILSKHLNGLDHGWAWSITGTMGSTQHVQFFGPDASIPTNVSATTAVTNAQWHMVTVTYTLSTKTLTFYVDGVLDTTISNVASPTAVTNAALYIGRDNPSASVNGNFFEGSMNDIRIYRRVVNSTEINQLLNALD